MLFGIGRSHRELLQLDYPTLYKHYLRNSEAVARRVWADWSPDGSGVEEAAVGVTAARGTEEGAVDAGTGDKEQLQFEQSEAEIQVEYEQVEHGSSHRHARGSASLNLARVAASVDALKRSRHWA